MNYKCIKTLKSQDGSISFVKDKVYEQLAKTNMDGYLFIDEQGDPHWTGIVWSKHFKLVK